LGGGSFLGICRVMMFSSRSVGVAWARSWAIVGLASRLSVCCGAGEAVDDVSGQGERLERGVRSSLARTVFLVGTRRVAVDGLTGSGTKAVGRVAAAATGGDTEGRGRKPGRKNGREREEKESARTLGED